MREILFRGKRIDNGEWVEGFCWENMFGNSFIRRIVDNIGCFRIENFEVDPETVGQYTGLNDKNGKRIFEGDIVADEYRICAPVVFEDSTFFADYEGYEPQALGEWCEVVGNIFDNPELLEVQG